MALRSVSELLDDLVELSLARTMMRDLALVLGVKDGLDNEVKNAYAASGAMHVLAVSGLHVGIIYLLVSFLFRVV